MSAVTVLGPNLPRHLADTGTLHVHAAGCADIARRYPTGRDQGGWTVEAASVADVVEAIYPADDFLYDPTNADEYRPYREDVHVFPCVRLPERTS